MSEERFVFKALISNASFGAFEQLGVTLQTTGPALPVDGVEPDADQVIDRFTRAIVDGERVTVAVEFEQ